MVALGCWEYICSRGKGKSSKNKGCGENKGSGSLGLELGQLLGMLGAHSRL